MPTFPSFSSPRLDYELNCVHRQQWHCSDSVEDMVTSENPTSARALSTGNVPGPLNIVHKLSHLIITTLWPSTIIIPILQMEEVRLREVKSQSTYVVGL